MFKKWWAQTLFSETLILFSLSVSCNGDSLPGSRSLPGCYYAADITRAWWLHAVDGWGFKTWIQAKLQYNEPVLKCTELLFYMRFTSSLPTASTSDCLNSSTSFSRAAAARSNVPRCINDTISPAALRSLPLMWVYKDVNAPVCLFVGELIKHWCHYLEPPQT